MKKLLMALVVAGMSVSAMAQTEEYPVREHSVETNSFWSNWFVSLGGGVQVMPIDRGENGVGLFETLTPNFTVSLGKWFTPGLGLRLQSHLPFYKNEIKFEEIDGKTYIRFPLDKYTDRLCLI